MVNIWRKVGGDLKLTNQKPVTKTEFEQMQTKKDFTSLMWQWRRTYIRFINMILDMYIWLNYQLNKDVMSVIGNKTSPTGWNCSDLTGRCHIYCHFNHNKISFYVLTSCVLSYFYIFPKQQNYRNDSRVPPGDRADVSWENFHSCALDYLQRKVLAVNLFWAGPNIS